MATHNISVTPQLSEQDEIRKLRLEALTKKISIGTDELERGDYSIFSSGKQLAAKIKAEGRRRVANRENSHA